MKQRRLSVYVTAVMVVLVIANCLAWLVGGAARFRAMGIYSSGFLIGMLAMYIAMHLYKWQSR
ncbi:hypothetical protein CfE428DRAFT_4222 [Chthoniobacter flavus Ellin428]|uniref:Uncharacterized protein n=1 Tax=Chthoniobacter flavus Ellin428 TaxID=497964 RepID=B4D5N3_9BACT|nr:hypothetical protein CfE428DRAFT_4222 [Chthoniobacter flavus Ellin428]TCO90853.1 hypothetical protein EV701_1092 [Chthoniobacter flavus]